MTVRTAVVARIYKPVAETYATREVANRGTAPVVAVFTFEGHFAVVVIAETVSWQEKFVSTVTI